MLYILFQNHPLDIHPGTTAELIYGERNTFKIAARHALHNKKKTFGFKINARYGSGNDFTLDPNDPDDQKVLSNFRKTINRADITSEGYVNTASPGTPLLTTDGLQQPGYWAGALNSSLYFRPVEGMEIVTAGGWNAGKAIFYNDLGEGVNFSNEYWGQARFNYKGWFAQTYYIKNDGGNDDNPVYLNRTGFIVPLERTHYEAQLQYNFGLPKFLNSEWSLGFDYRNATANTENHVYGRNENDDDYSIIGGYFQGKFKLDPKVDFFLAGRYDGYNFTDEKTFSPRVALVYKPNSNHNIRVSFNNAANPIPASDIYFDLPTQINQGLDVWVMGGKNPYTFGSDPSVDWLIPGVPNTSIKDGFPLAAAYSQVNELVLQQLQVLGSQYPQLAPLLPLILPILQNGVPGGFAPAAGFDIAGEPLEAEGGSAKLISQLSALEFGYKGLFWDRFALGFDVYFFRRTAGGGFGQISPIVNFVNLPANLGQNVQETFQPQIEQVLSGVGLDAAKAAGTAALIGQQLNSAYAQAGEAFISELEKAGLPFHGVIPTQEAPKLDNAQLIFGYLTRDPDAISRDWGYEIHSKYFINDAFSAFGNYTWFNRPSGEPGDLNFPQNKIRTGLSYQSDKKWTGSLSYQWNQAYTSNNAVYPGEIDAQSLFDLTLGYRLSKSLRFEAAATNLFNNEFRALPGLPKIGRTVTGRLVIDVN
ncbi:MAG: TonB-dependent receptor [Flavobacteriaceae bacterium]